ncbi:MAG: PQQ-binding-like beta-propeller repeat protein, partial [Phycisphaerae bacterium]|nr:PQQ-binding-like beta-propeller repeat protein [Phycisphaerae bacterium]
MRHPSTLCGICLVMFLAFTSPADGAGAKQALEQSGVTGGLVVHLGCGDGKQTLGLRANPSLLVHGLDRDSANVARARAGVMDAGLYGPVSIDRLVGDRLPYADNTVNLVWADDAQGIAMTEITRVLAPNGIALVGGAKTIKPWPKTTDEWTHFLHSPDGNAVGKDELIGPPRHLRWMGNPKFSRGHEQQASFSSAVTANGRMFYIADLAPTVDIRMPAQWTLVARDAFNGVVLWQRELGPWIDHLRRFRAGPASTQYRLVAAREQVFVTLDFQGPVHVLDARSGETRFVVEGSQFTKQILHRPQDNTLLLLTDRQVGEFAEIDRARLGNEFIQHECAILKVDLESGKTLWTYEVDGLVFPCVAYRDGRVFGQTPKSVFAVDDKNGKELWQKDLPITLSVAGGKAKSGELQWESPSIIVGDKAVYAADFKKVKAYAVENGYELWSGASAKGYNAPPDMHLIDGSLWMNAKGRRVALDPMTGETRKTLPTHRGYMHARCYRNKATAQYLMMGLMGVQMLDLKTGEIWDNDWIRGTCQYGILPANGLIYVPPDSCACNMKTKLSGIYALAGEKNQQAASGGPKGASRLEKGPAFGKVKGSKTVDGDWPTFRATAGRSGLNAAQVSGDLERAWSTEIGGRLSALSAADGRVFVAAIDRHTVYALDQRSGKKFWQFTAGGRVDTPPTIHAGAAYFGSADGSVYAVRAADGELIWRFRAAPEDRRVFVQGQLESVWPVHGSVLVEDGAVAFTAGRSSYLDGGITLYRLDAATGSEISQVVIYSPDEKGKQPSGGGKDVFGVLDDVLLSDGKDLYMRHCKLDYQKGALTETGSHLFSPIGLLDDTWWH